MNKILITLLAITITSNIYSQEDEMFVAPLLEPKVTFDFDIRGTIPMGEFEQFYQDEAMGGFGITTLFPISKNNPIDVGIDLAYYFMSATESTYDYYNAEDKQSYELHSDVSGSMIPVHAVVRIYPFKNKRFPVKFYVEGLGGFKMFVIDQDIETHLIEPDIELYSENEADVTSSWSYGFGVGFKVRISKNNLLYLNTKVNQLYGTETDYLDPTAFVLSENGNYQHLYNRSSTDMLQFSVGLHLMIE